MALTFDDHLVSEKFFSGNFKCFIKFFHRIVEEEKKLNN